jgi:parallel beta-helix repeat protein
MRLLDAKCVFMLLFLFLAMVPRISPMTATMADTSIIRVPNDFPTIQEAIDAATPGDTVVVNDGVYYERLIVNKTVNLVGADRIGTVIDANKTGTPIFVSADNVLIDGFTLRGGGGGGPGFSSGIFLNQSVNCTVSNNIITSNVMGITLNQSSNNMVRDNIVTSNGVPPEDGFEWGAGNNIGLMNSTDNTISGNVVSDSLYMGTILSYCNNTMIIGNVIRDNSGFTVLLSDCNTIRLHHNCFLGRGGIAIPPNSNDVSWDDGKEGNYWTSYTGLDDGSNSRVAGDGVGDTNLPFYDKKPLINPPIPIQVLWQNVPYPVMLRGNSTISNFDFSQTGKQVSFDVAGPMNTTGYFNLSIPTSLLSGPWTILLDRADVTSKAMMTENQTCTTIHLGYNHSSHNIQIIGTNVIPEYSVTSILLLSTLLALPPTILFAKKRKKNEASLARTRNG